MKEAIGLLLIWIWLSAYMVALLIKIFDQWKR